MLEARIRGISLLNSIRSFSSKKEASNYGSNNSISPFIYNRNPRNLERLRIAQKPSGFAMDNKPMNYWHRYFYINYCGFSYIMRPSNDDNSLRKIEEAPFWVPLVVEFDVFQCQEKSLISTWIYIQFKYFWICIVITEIFHSNLQACNQTNPKTYLCTHWTLQRKHSCFSLNSRVGS